MLPARSAFSTVVARPVLAAATLHRQPPLIASIHYTTRFPKPPTVNATSSAFSKAQRRWSATTSAPPATSLVKIFDGAAKKGDIALLQSTYRAILADPEASQPIPRTSFKNALFALQNSKDRSDFDFMNRLFVDMHQEFNIKPLAMEYTCLINAHGLHGKPAQALRLLSVMRDNDVSPTLHTYNILISALKRCQDTEGAVGVYRDMLDHGIEPDKVTYNMMIDLYFKNDQITQAYKLYTEMILVGHEADNFTYATLLTAATRFADVAIGAQIRDDLLVGHQRRSIDIVTVNALLAFIGTCVGDAGETLRIYRDLPLLFPSARPDIFTYNTMLDTCLKFGQAAAAHVVFRDMADAGIAPDVVTYGIMINAQARQGDAAAAVRLYDDMRQAGLRPDERVLVGLVNATVAAGQVKAVPALVRRIMAKDGVGPDLGVWKAVLGGLAKLGDAAGAQTLFNEVFVEGVEGEGRESRADMSVYTNLVIAHVNAGNVDSAMDIYYSLKERQESHSSSFPSLRFDTTFYTAIISALTKQSTTSLKVAFSLFSDMRALHIRPNAYTYTTLLTAVARDPSGCNLKLLEHIHGLIKMDLHLDPDAAVYNALMDGYARGGDNAAVLRIWDTLTQAVSEDIALPGSNSAAEWGLIDHATVSVVLDACGHNRAGYRAREIWAWLGAREFPVNTNNWCSYVECVLRTAEKGKQGWEEGFAAAKKMGKVGWRGGKEKVEVNEKTVRTLLAFARKVRVEEHSIKKVREWITQELKGRKNLLKIVAEEEMEYKEKQAMMSPM